MIGQMHLLLVLSCLTGSKRKDKKRNVAHSECDARVCVCVCVCFMGKGAMSLLVEF